MGDSVGSMEVEYSVVVANAIKNLKKYNDSIKGVETSLKNQSKGEAVAAKKSTLASKLMAGGIATATTAITIGLAAIAAGFVLVVAGLYSLIKASSYASVYSSQFGATLQQIANTFMEKTGLNVAIEDGLRAFQRFADVVGEQGFLVALLGLIKEFKTWSWSKWLEIKADPEKILGPIRGMWNIIKTLAIGLWNFLNTEIYPRIVSFWTNTLKPGIIWAFTTAWTYIKSILPQWITDIINWAVGMGKAIYEQDWQGVWDKVVEPFEWAWNKFKDTKLGGLIMDILNKIKEYSTEIQECFETIVEWTEVGKKIGQGIIDGLLAKLRSFGASPGVSPVGFKTRDSVIKNSKYAGWDDPGHRSASGLSGNEQLAALGVNDAIIAPGGKIITTHPADYLIATKDPGALSGNNQTFNISSTINITGNSNMDHNQLERKISKAIADEVKRIVKV